MSFAYYPANFRNFKNPEGLILRNIHGDHGSTVVMQINPVWKHEEIPFTYAMTPTCLTLTTDYGNVKICFAEPDVILFKGEGEGLGLSFTNIEQEGGYVYRISCKQEIYYMINKVGENCRYCVIPQKGEVEIQQGWDGESADVSSVCIHDKNGGFLLALREVKREWTPEKKAYSFEDALADAQQDFQEYCAFVPAVPAEYEECRQQAAYVNWSSIINKNGQLKRNAMLMSKNWMTHIWSWDHCFNAWASAYHNPEHAWDQFMVMFDFQHKSGAIPDFVDDYKSCWNFSKPPIHGWVFKKIMDLISFSDEQLGIAYDKLGRLTQWWFTCHDTDHNGICEYFHGNDSGWDNSTVFSQSVNIESPELSAFLIIQCDLLAELAEKLGRVKEKEKWEQKSSQTLKALLQHCFYNDDPTPCTSFSHQRIECDSLLPYLSIILGKRLPENVQKKMIQELKSNRFLTQYGFATESPASKFYISDGYWRGPIWAPSTMILVDGLAQCGENELALEVANRFCKMVKEYGFAENFDALTGEGLRDRAYTWTSSVFMILAHDYLL